VHSRIVSIADSLPAGTRWFIMDASAIAQIDSSATAMLEDVRVELSKRGISLGIAELHAEAREMLRRAGVLDRVGPKMIFDSLEDAQVAFNQTTSGSKEI
jgi:sulfate permease, SulP family